MPSTVEHPTKARPGASNGRWRGDAVGYYGAHQRLTAQRGRAADHPCADCGQPARHWSYDYDDPQELLHRHPGRRAMLRYSTDPEHYVPRCAGCHRRHDVGHQTARRTCATGRKLTALTEIPH